MDAQQRRERILELYAAGEKVAAIAKDAQCSISLVWLRIQQDPSARVKRITVKRQRMKAEVRQTVAEYKKEGSLRRTTRRLKRSKDWVSRRLHKAGFRCGKKTEKAII